MSYDPLKDHISSVEIVDCMGSDLSVVNAARVSFDNRSEWNVTSNGHELFDRDAKLIHYLAKHNHWTPFGHPQVTMRVKAPIFVARQLVKHQVGLVWNEVSRRYVSGNVEFFMPKSLRLAPEKSIKQGSSDETTAKWNVEIFRALGQLDTLYDDMIADGVAPEEARMILPLTTYTEWIWTGSLMAWLRIIKLRCDSHAQSQTRAYGEAFAKIISELFPVSYAAHTQTNPPKEKEG